MTEWIVYILRSRKNGNLYKGFTSNLERRIDEHNSTQSDAHSDKTLGPFDLVWYCSFKDREKAARFEKYLKSGSGRAFSNKHLL